CCSEALRAALKSLAQSISKVRAPNERAIATVLSLEPVSTTTTSSTHPRKESSARARFAASSRTIMHAETVIPAPFELAGRDLLAFTLRARTYRVRSGRRRRLDLRPAGVHPPRWTNQRPSLAVLPWQWRARWPRRSTCPGDPGRLPFAHTARPVQRDLPDRRPARRVPASARPAAPSIRSARFEWWDQWGT